VSSTPIRSRRSEVNAVFSIGGIRLM